MQLGVELSQKGLRFRSPASSSSSVYPRPWWFSSWAFKMGLRVALISFKVYTALILISHLFHLSFCSLFHLPVFFLWWQKIANRTLSLVLLQGLPSHAQHPLQLLFPTPMWSPPASTVSQSPKNPRTSPLVLKHDYTWFPCSWKIWFYRSAMEPGLYCNSSGYFNVAFYLISHLQTIPSIKALFKCIIHTDLLGSLLRGRFWFSRWALKSAFLISKTLFLFSLASESNLEHSTLLYFCVWRSLLLALECQVLIFYPRLETMGVVANRAEKCLCRQRACPFLHWKPSDGLHHCGRYLPLPLLPVSVLHGVSSVSEHQWEAVQPAGHEQSPAVALRGEQTSRLVWCKHTPHTNIWRREAFISDTRGSCHVGSLGKIRG